MNILHAVRSDGFAGVEQHIAGLAAAQAARGHRVAVIGGRPDRMQERLGHAVSHRVAASTADVIREVLQRLAWADVVHVHMTAAELAVSAALTIRAGRKPCVVTTRHFAGRRGRGVLRPVVASAAHLRVARQIAISHYVARHIDGAATVVYPGVTIRPDAAPAAQRDPTVLLVQRLEPEKRTGLALEIFARSGLAGRGWRLDVVGDGSLRADLQRTADMLGIEGSVRFLGLRSDIADLMARGAILLAPCDIEGLGLSVLEAMSSGLPVVATAAGGHLELLDGLDRRTLVPAGDVATGAATLSDLANDASGRDELARALQSRQRRRFTLAAQAAGTDDVYRSARDDGR